MAEWNAEQYMKFVKERTQPSIDLANRILLEHPRTVIDIGCGPGNSTRVLAERFPEAEILGVDCSPEMIQAAREKYPELSFALFDAEGDFSVLGKSFDVVFSNACIQWVPDHPVLLQKMMGILNPGGVLAVQTPMNDQEPIHRIIAELTESSPWREKFRNPRVFYNLTQEAYFDRLSELASDFTIWETVYCHRMPSHESIMEWYKGTGLRPYLAALSAEDAAAFEQEVFARVQKAYPMQQNGEILFRFPRFFFTAVK